MIVTHRHPKAGEVRTMGSPMGFGGAGTTRPPPLLGEHTDDILSGTLGYDAGRIAQLRAAGAVA